MTRSTICELERFEASSEQITAQLDLWAEQSSSAPEKILNALYPHMHRIAKGLFSRERADHTLQPTVLVHECFLKLVALRRIDWHGRMHFLSTATRLMRRILVDHARDTMAQKRGGDQQKVPIDEAFRMPQKRAKELIALDDALFSLRRLDSEKADIVELHYFGGISFSEVAAILSSSRSTVFRQWKLARLWLLNELASQPPGPAALAFEGHHASRDVVEV